MRSAYRGKHAGNQGFPGSGKSNMLQQEGEAPLMNQSIEAQNHYSHVRRTRQSVSLATVFQQFKVNLTYTIPVSIVNLVEVRSGNAFRSVFIAILCHASFFTMVMVI